MRNGPHILIGSDSGTGKSTFAASMLQEHNDKPVLIQAFDPTGRLNAYRKRADRTERKLSKHGVPVELLYKGDKLIGVMERWHEHNGRGSGGMTMKGGAKVKTSQFDLPATRFEQYLERMKYIFDEQAKWFGIIIDSVTYMELCIRSYLQNHMRVLDNKMLWGQATDEMERFMLYLLPDIEITLMVLAHVENFITDDEEKGGGRFNIRAPGRLRKDLFSAFGEVYRCYSSRKDGEATYYLQTSESKYWRCRSELGLEDPTPAHWKHIYKAAMELQK